MGARGVDVAQPFIQGAPGSSEPALQAQAPRMAPVTVPNRNSVVGCHLALHSLPAAARPAVGMSLANRLVGAVSPGVGTNLAFHLMDGADPDDRRILTCRWTRA